MRWILSPVIAALGILLMGASVIPFLGDAQNPETLVGLTWPLVGVYIALAACILVVAGMLVVYGLSK